MSNPLLKKSSSAFLVTMIAITGLCGAAPVSTPSPTSLTSPVQAGQWQMSQSMNIGPDANEVQTRTACFTQAQLQSDALAPLKPSPPPGREAVTCEIQNLVRDGMDIRYETRCAMPFGTMTTHWQGSFSGEDFIVVGRAQFLRRMMETKVSGKRLGECPN